MNEEKVKVGLSLDAALWAKVKAKAKKEKRTIAAVVEIALEEHLKKK